ncbi:S-adenosyl-L-methionine-dependent methyltransferase [Zopfia rhizophila CBS 207.26]|uniref:S-adenosyl-L-methionine-dependent methyltransferase n=1 Tax=Zopfia rhizophila CBS 207.26 TaxID=1314779 RepID=A0A6A6DA15_9PEZI|nr:S-adenosyl-L-methionine-dependent methyltransferase [Zopfia rhizophila CBS 207.26]
MSSSHYRFPEAETPVHDYFYSMVELGVVRVFVQHHVFDAIPDNGISISELSEKIHVEYNLLKRFSNFLVAARVLSSPAPGHIGLTPVSKIFQEPRATLFYSHIFDSFMVPAVKWTAYFSLNGVAEPQKSNQSPFGLAAGHPDKSFYEVLEANPERAKAFNATMALALGDMPVTGMYDFSWVAEYANQPGTPGRALIVDVGGGKGQALKAILEANPKIPVASCVLQDQPDVIQQAIEEDGVLRPAKKFACNFFDKQPTKGALIYYIRRVLNDWPDDECVTILSRIRSACATDSRVLISENLLPDEPSVSLAAADIWMMNFGGKRRNERMLEDIASRAGFRISSISKDKTSNSAVIEMVPV